MSSLKTVVDEGGAVHRLAPEPLGRGGQGVVFRTRSPDIAVKLITTGPPRPRSEGESSSVHLHSLLAGGTFQPQEGDAAIRALRERLDDVLLLPLEDLRIARPLALLRGQVGYTLRLLTDMEPISALIAPPGTEDLGDWYIASGGLRRRLRVLAKAARLLARIHALPVVYGDISPNNVFISTDSALSEVWLIDPDNLHLEGSRGPTVYTPGYGAPEVLSGKSRANTLSDAWGFAVLAFQVLCQTHPMLGEIVEAGDWESSRDMEAEAYAGLLPWIHDVDDDENYGELGIFPRELALSPKLRELFDRALGAGRLDPLRRPGMAEWADVFEQAANFTATCPSCGSTFFIQARTCTWCDEGSAPSFLYVQVRRWHPEVDDSVAPTGSSTGHVVIDAEQEVATLSSRMLRPLLAREREAPWIRLERRRRGYRVTPLAGGPYLLVEIETERVTDLDGPVELGLPVAGREWHLHCGSTDRPHRVASFRFFKGDSA